MVRRVKYATDLKKKKKQYEKTCRPPPLTRTVIVEIVSTIRFPACTWDYCYCTRLMPARIKNIKKKIKTDTRTLLYCFLRNAPMNKAFIIILSSHLTPTSTLHNKTPHDNKMSSTGAAVEWTFSNEFRPSSGQSLVFYGLFFFPRAHQRQ